jgi:hypothetical protein
MYDHAVNMLHVVFQKNKQAFGSFYIEKHDHDFIWGTHDPQPISFEPFVWGTKHGLCQLQQKRKWQQAALSVKHYRFESVGIQQILIANHCIRKPWCLIVPIAKTCGRKPGLKVAMIIVVVSITFPHHESSSDIVCSFIVHCQYDLSPQSNFPFCHTGSRSCSRKQTAKHNENAHCCLTRRPP